MNDDIVIKEVVLFLQRHPIYISIILTFSVAGLKSFVVLIIAVLKCHIGVTAFGTVGEEKMRSPATMCAREDNSPAEIINHAFH